MNLKQGLLVFLSLFTGIGFALDSVVDAKTYNPVFEKKIKDERQLEQLMIAFPKGADLHLHAAGAVRTETIIDMGLSGHYCIDPATQKASVLTKLGCEKGAIPFKTYLKNPEHRRVLLDAWSMEDFKESDKEDGKTHFFSTFDKFEIILMNDWPEAMADLALQASQNHIQYLELMLQAVGNKPLANDVGDTADVDHVLQNKAVQNYIQQNIAFFSQLNAKTELYKQEGAKAVKLAWVLEVRRNHPFKQVALDAIEAFAIANEVPDIVAINMVEAEYGKFAEKDYLKQMEFMASLHERYPNVMIVIHAGEVPQNMVKNSKVPHVLTALNLLHPVRIGHATTIEFENNHQKTLQLLSQKDVAVEINLSSNDEILGIKGKEHPLVRLLKQNVPVVLSSDDPGVSRNSLSHEYARAVVEHHLSLTDLIQVSRNSLTYSLLPGESIWMDARKNIPVPVCAHLHSKACEDFILEHPKALEQWRLEIRFSHFLKKYLSN
jgi:adenosine deaminase